MRNILIAAVTILAAAGMIRAEQTSPVRTIPLDSGWRLPPEARIAGAGGRPVLTVTVPPGESAARQVVARRTLNLVPYRGHQVEFVYEVRADRVSRPPEEYNGVKLMLHYKDGEKNRWPNAPRRYSFGSYDWSTVTVRVYFGHNVKDGELLIGLQNSSGRIEIRSVEIRDLGAVPDPHAAPVPLPENYRAEYTARISSLPRLRGVMSPNSYHPEDLEELARWNSNLIRWQIKKNWGGFNADRDIPEFTAWFQTKLDELEKVLNHCRKLGIKVAVDMHGAPGARLDNFDLAMLHEKKYADAFIACWEKLAARFRGHPAVWAYDIINEPQQHGAAPVNYLAIQYRAAAAIRAIDPDVPLIVTCNIGGPDTYRYLKPLPLKDVIYTVHMYEPISYTHQGISGVAPLISYPGTIDEKKWDRTMLKKQLEPVRDFQEKYGARIYVGEFSAVRYAPGAARWLEDVISLFEEYGWDWSYHAFRESHFWSVEHVGPDGAHPVPADEDTDRKRVLLRYFKKNEKPE